MNRLALPMMFMLAACFESHDANMRQLTSDDCYACHEQTFAQPDVQQIHGAFAAPGGTPPTTCGDCHTTDSWDNGLGGPHPKPNTFTYTDPVSMQPKNETFLIDSTFQKTPHTGIKCLACHDLDLPTPPDPKPRGYNANCTQCHPNDSRIQTAHLNAVRTFPGVTLTYTGYKDADPTFCRSCHPDGLAQGHGPSNPFRLPHRGSTCDQCHDTASGLGHTSGADVRCVTSGCHNGVNSDRAHCSDTGHHPGCLNQGCHPDGRTHDGNVSCPPKSST